MLPHGAAGVAEQQRRPSFQVMEGRIGGLARFDRKAAETGKTIVLQTDHDAGKGSVRFCHDTRPVSP